MGADPCNLIGSRFIQWAHTGKYKPMVQGANTGDFLDGYRVIPRWEALMKSVNWTTSGICST
jgi:hypothetical protein